MSWNLADVIFVIFRCRLFDPFWLPWRSPSSRKGIYMPCVFLD